MMLLFAVIIPEICNGGADTPWIWVFLTCNGKGVS